MGMKEIGHRLALLLHAAATQPNRAVATIKYAEFSGLGPASHAFRMGVYERDPASGRRHAREDRTEDLRTGWIADCEIES